MRTFACAVTICALVLTARPSRAQDAPEHELARKHYETGASYYKISRYKDALEEFQKAYSLQPRPALLFNIARCHEVLGELEPAIQSYQLYLEKKPDAPDRDVVEARIKNIQERIEESRKAETPSPAPQSAPAPAEPQATKPLAIGSEPPASTERPTRWRRVAGWSAVGVGAAALIAGVVVGTRVTAKSTEYSDAVDAKRTYFELNQIADEGRSLERVQLGLLISGAVIAAAGGGLLTWDLLGHEEAAPRRTSLRPLVGPSGFGLAASTHF